eukprot:s1324_g6.t5
MRYSKYVKKPLETSGNSACAAATILAQNQPASPAGATAQALRKSSCLVRGLYLLQAGGRILQATEAHQALLHHAGNAFLVMLALPARLASRCTAEPAQRRIATVCARRACVAT